jgi:uncharacterized iron-regulated protein
MASPSTLGSRRNAAQLHALAGVKREVRANDSSARRKYLRDFAEAYRGYEGVLTPGEVQGALRSADIVLIGDYHALPASQQCAAGLLEKRAQPGDRPIVLGVETIFSRHQHVLDEWWRREIDGEELRHRIRFDAEWGYDWPPFFELLVTAREHAEAIYGLDCMPRDDLRKIGARDRHAAEKIAEIRERHPDAVIFVLFGESHLAPGHLPALLKESLPQERSLVVLQNIDSLYWKATSERQERVDAVRVDENTICLFNATPLEKYESYRMCLSRWREEQKQPEIAPTLYNLLDGLLRFLNIDRYSPHNTSQPKFLVDLLPEIYSGVSETRTGVLLQRESSDSQETEMQRRKIEAQGVAYLPRTNVFFMSEFHMMFAAEEMARFLHHACRGLPERKGAIRELDFADRFAARVIEHALAYCGSRILYPARPAVHLEGGVEPSRLLISKFMAEARHDERRFECASQQLGFALGTDLYDAYVRGCVSRTSLRRLFLAHLEETGEAQEVLQDLVRKVRSSKKKPVASVQG